MGPDLAPVDRVYSAPIDHGSPRFRKGLAAPRRPALDLQGGPQENLEPVVAYQRHTNSSFVWNTGISCHPGLGVRISMWGITHLV